MWWHYFHVSEDISVINVAMLPANVTLHYCDMPDCIIVISHCTVQWLWYVRKLDVNKSRIIILIYSDTLLINIFQLTLLAYDRGTTLICQCTSLLWYNREHHVIFQRILLWNVRQHYFTCLGMLQYYLRKIVYSGMSDYVTLIWEEP